jgi:hypothetical protein
MKTSKALFTFTAATLLTCNAFAAAVTQYLKVIVADNSNLTVQQPTAFMTSFSSSGNDQLDSYDMGNQNSLGSLNEVVYPFSITDNNNIITQQDSRPCLTGYKRIRFGFATKFPATIKIIAFAFGNTSDSTNRPAYAWIEQISTGYIYPILGDTVKLDVPANLNFESDFYLHTGPMISVGKLDETCYHSYNGNISVNNPTITNWNLSIYKNNTLFLSTPVNQPDTVIGNLTSANYAVVTSVNGIPVDSSVVFINGEPEINPDFMIDNYNPTTNDEVSFTDLTALNSATVTYSYSWTYGDGNSDNAQNGTHQYLADGNYEVVLTITSDQGCTGSNFDTVYVSTPINSGGGFGLHFHNTIPDGNTFEPDANYTVSNEKLSITNNTNENMTAILMDMNGRVITTTTSSDSNFEMPVANSGTYIVQLISSKGEVKSKTILITK